MFLHSASILEPDGASFDGSALRRSTNNRKVCNFLQKVQHHVPRRNDGWLDGTKKTTTDGGCRADIRSCKAFHISPG